MATYNFTQTAPQIQDILDRIQKNTGASFMGVATPSTNTTSITTQRVFYIAGAYGIYLNMGGFVHSSGIGVFYYNGSQWSYSEAVNVDSTPTENSVNPVQSDGVVKYVAQALSSIDPIIIEGNVDNAPDEEDLTSVDQSGTDVLKFKDKAYAPALFSGLGRKYLRKNITGGKNVLTSAMVADENTIYHIQYDYDLNGQTLTIPSNSALEFDGGSIANGTIVLNGVNIIANTFGCFKNVVLNGNVYNEKIDVRVVSIKANDNTFDAGAYIKDYLLGVNGVEWFFPAGNYYLSELFITTDNFSISGVAKRNDNVTLPTKFYPFNNSQYYIIKVGGKETALSPTNRVKGVKIHDIQFSAPSTFTPKTLTNEYGNTADYTSALCILDFIQVGLFGISGSSNYANLPSLLIGQIYECEFDYLLFYGGAGPSNCPRVQFVCSQSYSISATNIKLIMAESITGPIISTSEAASIVELTIDQVFFEGVMIWASGITDATKYGTDYVEYSEYDCVPVFNIQGFATIKINNISLTEINYSWKNTADQDATAVHYRSFIKSNLTAGTITIGNVYNGGGAETLYIDNVKTSPWTYLARINLLALVSCAVQLKSPSQGLLVNTFAENDVSKVGHTDRYAYLCPQKLYIGTELQQFAMPAGTNAKIFGGSLIEDKGLSHRVMAALSQSAGANGGQILTTKGFIIPTDYLYILCRRDATTLKINISYCDSADTEISSEAQTFVPTADKLNYWLLKLNKPSNCHHIVLYNQTLGYNISIYGIMATNEAVYAMNSGTTANRPAIANVNKGFEYFDSTLGKTIISNGTEWVDSTGVPVADSVKVLKITQSAYDALQTKDSSTLYVITTS